MMLIASLAAPAFGARACVAGVARAAWRIGLPAVAAALVAGCGGGDQVQTFSATRVIAFGDETSVINADGSKYTVNALATGSTTVLDCVANPIWIQAVAATYGLAFPECPGTAANPVSRIRAVNGARVADLAGQIDQQLATGAFQPGDLATVLLGVNDVIAQFAQYPAVGEAQLLLNIDAVGEALADQANRLADAGVKVVISTIPDVGYMPFAGDRSAGSTNPNPAVLSRLSVRLNDSMLARLRNDGRQIGLVQLDQYLIGVDRATSVGRGYANSTLPACTVALPSCTTATLVAAAQTGVWLWADDRHLGAAGQNGFGSLAASRARANPF